MATYYVAMDDNYTPLGVGTTRDRAMRDATIDGDFGRDELKVYECSARLYKSLLIPGWVDIGHWTVDDNGIFDVDESE